MQKKYNGKKLMSEKETREQLIAVGRDNGIEMEIRAIFNKIDNSLRKCTNPEERKAISEMGVLELNKLFDPFENASMEINGKAIYGKIDRNYLKEQQEKVERERALKK